MVGNSLVIISQSAETLERSMKKTCLVVVSIFLLGGCVADKAAAPTQLLSQEVNIKQGEPEKLGKDKLSLPEMAAQAAQAAADEAQKIIDTQAHATPQLLDVERVLTPYWRSLALINIASQCQIRSENWRQSLAKYLTARIDETDTTDLSSDEMTANGAYASQIMAEARFEFQVDDQNFLCQKYLNSRELVRLDKLQTSITRNRQ
jgi:outer membrane murein-binding lipoprotein Lpp